MIVFLAAFPVFLTQFKFNLVLCQVFLSAVITTLKLFKFKRLFKTVKYLHLNMNVAQNIVCVSVNGVIRATTNYYFCLNFNN